MSEIECVDLFCGAGGLTFGLNAEGVNVVAGIDVDELCRHPFEVNNSSVFVNKDVSVLTGAETNSLFTGASRIKVLAGCAPCQPFSTYSQRYDTVGTPRWGLLYKFGHIAKELRPDIITMENVPTVARHAVFDDLIATLKSAGYDIFHEVIDCSTYGLPQGRKRTVLLASLHGPIELIPQTHKKPRTVRQALSKLPHLNAGETNTKDPLHRSASLSDLNLERIKASIPGGTWRDWPEHLVAECHRRESGKTYPGVYGRMEWDAPSPTLTTQFYGFGNGRFGHPEQDRAISLREGAILQGFPRTYSFIPKGQPVQFTSLGRLIGNAVPVTLGRIIGRSINLHLGTASKTNKKTSVNGETTSGRARALVA